MYIARERPKRALAAPPFLFLIYSARENCARKSVEAELFMMGRRSLAREWKKREAVRSAAARVQERKHTSGAWWRGLKSAFTRARSRCCALSLSLSLTSAHVRAESDFESEWRGGADRRRVRARDCSWPSLRRGGGGGERGGMGTRQGRPEPLKNYEATWNVSFGGFFKLCLTALSAREYAWLLFLIRNWGFIYSAK